MKNLLYSIALLSSFLIGLQAADPKPVITNPKPIEKSAVPKPKGMPFNGTISAVDKTANTISLGKQKIRIFHLSPKTKITKNKLPATVNDLAAGEHAGGYAFENAEGKLEVKTLNVSDVAKNAPPEPEKRKQ
jgi:hypothetical protein